MIRLIPSIVWQNLSPLMENRADQIMTITVADNDAVRIAGIR